MFTIASYCRVRKELNTKSKNQIRPSVCAQCKHYRLHHQIMHCNSSAMYATKFLPSLRSRLNPRETCRRQINSARRLLDSKPSQYKPVPARRTGNSDRIKILPLIFIFIAGTAAFRYLLASREGTNPRAKNERTIPATSHPGSKNNQG